MPVDFDDPSVAERSASVHVAVEEVIGKESVPVALTFRMGLLNAHDPDLFLDGLRSLGHVAVALTRHPRHADVLLPAEQGALIGRIDETGGLTFPALAPAGDEFLAGIATVDKFRTTASEADEMVVLVLPESYG